MPGENPPPTRPGEYPPTTTIQLRRIPVAWSQPPTQIARNPAGFPLPGPAENGSSRRPPWGNKEIRSDRWEDVLVSLRDCQSGFPYSLFPGAG